MVEVLALSNRGAKYRQRTIDEKKTIEALRNYSRQVRENFEFWKCWFLFHWKIYVDIT